MESSNTKCAGRSVVDAHLMVDVSLKKTFLVRIEEGFFDRILVDSQAVVVYIITIS
jgi:hypothetical protein